MRLRITARGKETKQWREPVFEARDPYRAVLLAVLWQAGTDYHDAKRLQKRRNVKTANDVLRLKKWEKEVIERGKVAREWFLEPEAEEGSGITFQQICRIFGARPSRMWWRIKNSPDLSRKLGEMSAGDSKSENAKANRALDAESVRKAREMAAQGVSQHEIAHTFSVAQNTISKVIRRETWKHVA